MIYNKVIFTKVLEYYKIDKFIHWVKSLLQDKIVYSEMFWNLSICKVSAKACRTIFKTKHENEKNVVIIKKEITLLR